jgi:hypothetical protein
MSPKVKPETIENADPFFTLGRLTEVISGSSIPGISRSPTQRLRAARAILAEWKAAANEMKAAGRLVYMGIRK